METVFCSNCGKKYLREVMRIPNETRPIILDDDYCSSCGTHGLSTSEFIDHDIAQDIQCTSIPEA